MQKQIYLILSFILLVVSANGVTFSGTAISSISNAVAGNSSFVVIDTGDDGIDFGANSLGVMLTSGSFIGSTNDFVVSYNSVVSFIGTTVPGNATFTLDTDGNAGTGSNLDENTPFYIIAFGTKFGDGITTEVGDTFGISQEANWVLPTTNGANPQFGSAFTQAAFIDAAGSGIVPEPSAYAMLTGVLALGFTALRRRR